MLYHGVKIVYFGGDVLKLKDDWALIKPTFLAIVPRLLTRDWLLNYKIFMSQDARHQIYGML